MSFANPDPRVSWRAIFGYLTLRPVTLGDGVVFYRSLARAFIESLVNAGQFNSAGQFLSRPVLLRARGIVWSVRGQSDDLGYVSSAHKRQVDKWFKPKPGDMVVDVGAHIGRFTLLAGLRGARVLALEPNPATFSQLQQNFTLNPGMNVKALNVAAGDKDAIAVLHTGSDFTGLGSLDSSWLERTSFRGKRVDYRTTVVTLDGLLSRERVDRIDWLIVDTEGFEWRVLVGAMRSLKLTQNLIIEVSYGPHLRDCERLIAESGMEIRARAPQTSVNEYWCATRS